MAHDREHTDTDAAARTGPRRRGGPLVWILIVAVVAIVATVLAVFQPQRLLYDQVVADELPAAGSATVPPTDGSGAAADVSGGADREAAPRPEDPDTSASASDPDDDASDDDDSDDDSAATEPRVLATGSFGSLGRYTTVGEVRVLELPDGRRFVRLEDFETTNGPDLYVYLTAAPADGSGDFAASSIDLGRLRGNIGDQNYEIPADVSLDDVTGVVIYCARFSSPFGAADLVEA